MMDIKRKSGLLQLWRGNSLNMLRIFPYTALQFSLYDKFMENYFYENINITSKKHAVICGGLSGIFASSVVYPLDLLRTRMAIRKNDGLKLTELIQVIRKKHHLNYFFRGIQMNVLGIILYKGIAFYFYETILDQFQKIDLFENSHYIHGVSAAIASLSGQFITYPFDLIKRRLMVNESANLQFKKENHTINLINLF